MQTLGETPVEVEAKALVDKLFKTRHETPRPKFSPRRSSTDWLREYLSEGLDNW